MTVTKDPESASPTVAKSRVAKVKQKTYVESIALSHQGIMQQMAIHLQVYPDKISTVSPEQNRSSGEGGKQYSLAA